MFSLGAPGLPEPRTNVRLPLCGLDHDFVAKGYTYADILRIITWSLDQCAYGAYPSTRHDGSPWHHTDPASRKKLAGQPLGCAALLCQVVGDWKMFKDVFQLPQHNEARG